MEKSNLREKGSQEKEVELRDKKNPDNTSMPGNRKLPRGSEEFSEFLKSIPVLNSGTDSVYLIPENSKDYF